MSLEKKKLSYSQLAKAFHWGFVILFVFGVAKQVDNISQLEDIVFFRFEIIFALIFLLLLILRLIYMKKTQNTSLPPETPKIQKIIAKSVHNGMYFLLAGTVLSGLLIGALYWLGFKEGYLLELTVSVHELIINLLYGFIAVHVVAATYHRFKNDGVWSSMVPIFKEKNKS